MRVCTGCLRNILSPYSFSHTEWRTIYMQCISPKRYKFSTKGFYPLWNLCLVSFPGNFILTMFASKKFSLHSNSMCIWLHYISSCWNSFALVYFFGLSPLLDSKYLKARTVTNKHIWIPAWLYIDWHSMKCSLNLPFERNIKLQKSFFHP